MLQFIKLLILAMNIIFIASCALAILFASIALISKKGGKSHRQFGQYYIVAMCGVFLVGPTLQMFAHRYTLLVVLFFSFYLLMTGYRALFTKWPNKGMIPKPIDWALPLSVFLVSAICYVIAIASSDVFTFIQLIIFWVFYNLFLVISIIDIYRLARAYRPSAHKNNWLYEHMSRMFASALMILTMILVLYGEGIPFIIRWVAPLLLGSLFAGGIMSHYRTKVVSYEGADELFDLKYLPQGRDESNR